MIPAQDTTTWFDLAPASYVTIRLVNGKGPARAHVYRPIQVKPGTIVGIEVGTIDLRPPQHPLDHFWFGALVVLIAAVILSGAFARGAR